MRYILLTLLVLIGTLLSCAVNSSELIPTKIFAKAANYKNITLSPNARLMAFETLDNNGDDVVVVMNTSSKAVVSVMKFVGRSYPVNPVWINNKRLLTQVAKKSLRTQVERYTGELFVVDSNGENAEWLIKNVKSAVTTSAISRDVGNKLSGYGSLVSLLPEDKDHILISVTPYANKKKFRYNSVHKINIHNGREKFVTRSPIEHGSFIADKNGDLKVAWGNNLKDKNHVLLFEFINNKWQQSKKLNDISAQPLTYNDKSGELIATYTIKDEPNQLVSINLETGVKTFLYQHKTVDISSIDFTLEGEPYAIHIDPNYADIELLNPKDAIAKWYPSLYKKFPNSRVEILSESANRKKFIFRVSADRIPVQYYLFDVNQKKYSSLIDNAKDFEGYQLAESIPIKYKSRDGLDINGYLTLPNGKESNLPLIVFPHGGPISRDYWDYDWMSQFLANRGYAVLQMNFRGSSGYGQSFINQGKLNWGSSIQYDIIDGVNWATSIGIAEPQKVCIIGGSFGAYSALMNVHLEPDLYKCAIGISGIYDLNLMWEDGDIYNYQYGENYLIDSIGVDKVALDQFSPANYTKKMSTPILLVHGSDDFRAPISHFDKLLSKLEDNKKEVKTLIIEDEGHSLVRDSNRLLLLNEIEDFVAKHLK